MGRVWRAKEARGSAGAAAGGAVCGEDGGVAGQAWSPLLCAGYGDQVSLVGRGRGSSRTGVSARGRGLLGLVSASVWQVGARDLGGGAGGWHCRGASGCVLCRLGI